MVIKFTMASTRLTYQNQLPLRVENVDSPTQFDVQSRCRKQNARWCRPRDARLYGRNFFPLLHLLRFPLGRRAGSSSRLSGSKLRIKLRDGGMSGGSVACELYQCWRQSLFVISLSNYCLIKNFVHLLVFLISFRRTYIRFAFSVDFSQFRSQKEKKNAYHMRKLMAWERELMIFDVPINSREDIDVNSFRDY